MRVLNLDLFLNLKVPFGLIIVSNVSVERVAVEVLMCTSCAIYMQGDAINAEEQPPAKKRLLSAVVKV